MLADTGHLDLAYRLLRQDGEPSWLTMIDRGATTMWEHWNGVDADGTPRESLNHYSQGRGDLLPAPVHRRHSTARRRARPTAASASAPRPGGGLTCAEAAHECPYGRIESAWSIAGDQLHLQVLVPAGTSATVVLPDGETRIAGPGRHSYAGRLPEPHEAPALTG